MWSTFSANSALMHFRMMSNSNAAANTWRKAFAELLVFEQDFDTVMQIMMFQDAKVPCLSLQNFQQTRSQRTQNTKDEDSIRCTPRGPSRKRRRAVREASSYPNPSPIPSSHNLDMTCASPGTRSNDFLRQLGVDKKVVSAGLLADSGAGDSDDSHSKDTKSKILTSWACTRSKKQDSVSTLSLIANKKKMWVAGSNSSDTSSTKQLRAAIDDGYRGAGRSNVNANIGHADRGQGAESGLVASLFCTGSGKRVSISKTKLDAYERQILNEGAEDLATSKTQSAETLANVGAENNAEYAGAGRSDVIVDDCGADRGMGADRSQAVDDSRSADCIHGAESGLVTSLFCTGSGKRVSISKTKLDAYERQILSEDSNGLATSKIRSAETFEQLGAGIDAGFAKASRASVRGDEAESDLASRFFELGSVKQVSISKAKLASYEKQIINDGSDVPATAELCLADTFDAGMMTSIGLDRADDKAYVSRADRDEGSKLRLVTNPESNKQVLGFEAKLETYQKRMWDMDSEVLVPLDHNDKQVGAGAGSGNSDCTFDHSYLPSSTNNLKNATLLKELDTWLAMKAVIHTSSNKSTTLTKNSGAKIVLTPQRRIYEDKNSSKTKNSDNFGIEWNGDGKNVTRPISNDGGIINVDISTSRRQRNYDLPEKNQFGRYRDLKNLVAFGLDRGTNFHNHRLPKQDFDDKENIHPETMLALETSYLQALKPWQSSMTSKQSSITSNQMKLKLPRTQATLQQRRLKRTFNSSMMPCSDMVNSKRFHPPVARKRVGASNLTSFQDVGQSTAPQQKKQKLADNEAKPFIYGKAMKISLATLIGLHDDRYFGSGDFKMPRLQLLNSITAKNAHMVYFGQDGSLNCAVGDTFDTTLFMGPRELYRQLKAGKHILKKSGVTFIWFLNHYRWIVWKLAAMERSFPRLLLANYLTKDQVIKQITYRYQREFNSAEHSILKKILQRDASFSSCMVLCVAAVLPFSASSVDALDQDLPASWNMALVLTDGWYSVYAVPDAPLAAVLWKLHLKASLVGTKLVIWNATLHNSTEGIDPLECTIVRDLEWKNPLLATENLTQWPYLQLRYNSTRRVRFDTRLGLEKLRYLNLTKARHRKQQPQLSFSLLKSVPLKSLEVGGGIVRSVRIRATRVSSILYLQSKEWTLGPRILCEEQLPLYLQLRFEYAQAAKQKKLKQNVSDSTADDWSGDDQIDVPLPVPFIKVDVECTNSPLDEGIGCGILTIWRPSEELLSGSLREGAEHYCTSLSVNWKVDGGRGQDAFVRLSSTKHSGFEEVNKHDSNEICEDTLRIKRHRVCVDVQQATTDYRTNFEEGINGRRNERRPTIDICVCIVLVSTRETLNASSSMTANQSEVSLLDAEIKPEEYRYVEHVFVTDLSCHLMSIRVSSMEVSMPTIKNNNNSKRSSLSSFLFRRGGNNVWKEGAIVCLSGLQVSHYDEQLRVLDCVLVESTQIVSFPSKRSPFWDQFQLLQREVGIPTTRGTSQPIPPISAFSEELIQLRKYVEREILQMNCVASQEKLEHYVEKVEQKCFNQDLRAHEEDGETITAEHVDESSACQMWWDANIVKMMPLAGPSSSLFSQGEEFSACVRLGTSNAAYQTVYLTREVMLVMQTLLQQAAASGPFGHQTNVKDVSNTTVFQSVMQMLNTHKKQHGDYTFRFKVQRITNQRLLNSWKPWQRLHASYWITTTVVAREIAR